MKQTVLLPRIKRQSYLTTILEVCEEQDDQDMATSAKPYSELLSSSRRSGSHLFRQNSLGYKQNNSVRFSSHPKQRNPLTRTATVPLYQVPHCTMHDFCTETLQEKKRKLDEKRSSVLDFPLIKKTANSKTRENHKPNDAKKHNKENERPNVEKWLQFFG